MSSYQAANKEGGYVRNLRKTDSRFPNLSAYYVNTVALIPRLWIIYVVLVLYPLIVFVNIDGGPNKDDSGHYFSLWYMGVFLTSCLVAEVVAAMMRMPVLYCMPKQPLVMRRVVLIVGLLANMLFMAVSILPKYSYWAPSTVPGLAAIFIIGLMFYLLIIVISIQKRSYAIAITVVYVMTFLYLSPELFRGSGPEIVRPPMLTYALLTFGALLMIPFAWKALGSRSSLRELMNRQPHQPNSGSGNEIAVQIEKVTLLQRSSGSQCRDFSVTEVGTRLLNRISSTSNVSIRLFSSLIYRIRSANERRKVIGIWLVVFAIGIFMCFNLSDSFNLVFLIHILSLLIAIQGEMIFRRTSTPFLPLGRRAYFGECLFNAALRYLLLIGVLLMISVLSLSIQEICLYRDPTNQVAMLSLPIKTYSFYLLLLPTLMFMFHLPRSFGWIIPVFLANVALFATLPVSSTAFTNLSFWIIAFLMPIAWIPFLSLTYLKSFRYDLK